MVSQRSLLIATLLQKKLMDELEARPVETRTVAKTKIEPTEAAGLAGRFRKPSTIKMPFPFSQRGSPVRQAMRA